MYRKILALFLIVSFDSFGGLPPTVLSGQSQTIKPTTFSFKTPYNQATQISGIESLIETGNENLLVNPSFEGGTTGWTCTVGTCSKTTTAGQFSSGKAALSVALSAQAMNVSQTVTTVSGIQKQGYARVIYRVPATMADFQICSLVDAAEQTCVPTANLIKDDTFRSIEIPLTFGSTSAGINFKTTSSYTATAYFDGAVVAQGLGTQNLMLDNTYSAQVSNAGVVSGENKDFINGNCAITSTNKFTCPYNSGLVTLPMSCLVKENAIPQTGFFSILEDKTASSASQLVYSTYTGTAAPLIADPRAVTIICQKSGNDYLASSANVYSSTNGNTYFGSLTTTGTWTTNTTYSGVYWREDDFLVGTVKVLSTGAPNAVALSINLPNGLSADTTKLKYDDNNTSPITGSVLVRDSGTGTYTGGIRSVIGTPTKIDILNYDDSAGGIIISAVGATTPMTFAANDSVIINFKIPIAGWSNSNIIVGSFAGVPAVPGYQGLVDTFSVSYGTTNATTVCSATPCSYLDQIGTAVSSVTRSGTGAYVLNTSKTYTKLKCTSNTHANGTTASTPSPGLRCENCNSISFNTLRTDLSTAVDSTGSLMCQGTY